MRRFMAVFALFVAIVAGRATWAGPVDLGGPGGGTVRSSGPQCSDTNLQVHHDGSFENAIAWEFLGVQEPYYGAFGEAYDLGPGTIECVSLWLTQVGQYGGETTDVYVWDGGVSGEPGAVLALVTGVVFEEIGVWPDITRHDVEIPVVISGDATVGSWGSWVAAGTKYLWAVDHDAPGHPWTYAFPDFYGEGWLDPGTIWDSVQSMGIGVHFTPEDPVPTRDTSWGELKRLYTGFLR